MEHDEQQVQKKVSFIEDKKFKTPQSDILPLTHEAGVMCTINGQSFYTFRKHMWIDDLGALWYINNNNADM